MMTPSTNHRGFRRSAVLVAAASLFLFACSSDGESPLTTAELPVPEEPAPEEPAPEEPAPEEPAPEEPAPEEPAPEEPAPEEPAPEEPASETPVEEDDGLTSEQWIFIILGGLLIIAVIAAIAALLSRKSSGASGLSSEQVRLDGLTQTGRAIHDSTMLTVLQQHEPAALQSVWNIALGQFADFESQLAVLTQATVDPSALAVLRELEVAAAGARGALEANVSGRLGGQSAELLEASSQTALARRAQLGSALQRAAMVRL